MLLALVIVSFFVIVVVDPETAGIMAGEVLVGGIEVGVVIGGTISLELSCRKGMEIFNKGQ